MPRWSQFIAGVALAGCVSVSSALADPPAPASPGALALAQGLVVAKHGDDPKILLFDYDPERLARQLDLPEHWQAARLAAAAKAVGQADRPLLREALTEAYAGAESETDLRLELVYAESLGGRAEVEKDDLRQARQADLDAAYWPAYRRAFERVACQQLACPPAHYVGEPQAPTGAALPQPSPATLAAAERYFQAAGLYERPVEGREAIVVMEVVELERANPHADRALLQRVDSEAMTAADAAIWPSYRRDMVRLYAATFSAAELDGLAAREADPAFKAIEARAGPVMLRLAAAWMPVQRRMLEDTKARFCSEVGCPSGEARPSPDDHQVS